MGAPSSYTPKIPAFERCGAQPQVAAYLENALKEKKVSHAYLFVGAPGSGQVEAAKALAKGLVCPKDGCNACEECIRVDRKSHPDIHWISPEGAGGYLAEQVRNLIKDVNQTPVRADVKVYILERAETLTGTSANAMLKTIEEPPEDVVFILMARSIDLVLPTIASRCQCVPFRVANTQEAIRQIMLTCGLPNDELARIALSVTGAPEAACDFIRSAKRRDLRQLIMRTFAELPQDDYWDVLVAAKTIMDTYSDKQKNKNKDKKKKVSEEDLTPEEQEALKQEAIDSEFLSQKALKLKEQAKKRDLTARERSGMMEIIATAESLIRDVLVRVSGTEESLVNTDAEYVVERLSQTASTAACLRALEACGEAATDLAHNVTPQLILEVMLLHCKEALCPPLSR